MGNGSERAGSPATVGGRFYANDLTVEFSLAEFVLDFVQNYGADDKHPQSRLITSPTNMAEFQRVIETALADYEKRYGAIPRRSPAGAGPIGGGT